MERAGKSCMFTPKSVTARQHAHTPKLLSPVAIKARLLIFAHIERFESLHKFPSHFV